jgi:hypothetical protein
VNPPWGGHGFNTSVGDAVNIAWKIAAVLQGWASERLLASYDPERRDVVEKTVASAASHLSKMAGDLPQDEASIQQAKGPEFYSLGLVLGYSYAGSPVIQPSAGPPALTGATSYVPTSDPGSYVPASDPGARLPHWWLPDGSSLYDHLGPGFTLLRPDPGCGRDERISGGPASEAAVADLLRRARDRRIPLTVVQAPPSYPWAEEFLLVRPDQHIAWRADDPADIDIEAAVGHTVEVTAARIPRLPEGGIG